jgi:hypothetical protein
MSREDVIFGLIRPTAEAMLRNELRGGGVVDLPPLTERILDAFRGSLDLGDERALRARLNAFLLQATSRDRARAS